VLEEVLRHKRIQPLLGERIDADTVLVHPSERGNLKQQLLKIGWPAEDLAGYVDGEAHPIDLREDGWTMRPYQRQAVEGFWHGGSGSSCCRAAPARRSSAPARWPRPGRRPSSS
jgi:DNA excision repair protein ERCC-3